MISDWCEQNRVWRNIEIDDKVHVICFMKADSVETWKIVLTDLVEIWVETLTHDTMFRKCQTLNPLLSIEAFDWKQMVMDMLMDIPKYIIEASVHQIKLQKAKDFIKLRFSIDLTKGKPQEFWENITVPLCLSSMELLRQHEILLDLVKKKDEEIAEYKAEGAELVRKYIATKPFGEELFRTDIAASNATDLAKTFQSMSQFYNAINMPKSHIKVESEVSLNDESDNICSDSIPKIEEKILPDLSKDEFVRTKENELDENEKSCLKDEECDASPSTSKASILKLNSMSHTIQKSLRKNKKNLSNLIL